MHWARQWFTSTSCAAWPMRAATSSVTGDDHELDVIGWACCCMAAMTHPRAVADFLVKARRAAPHLSAISLNLADEVRRIVAADPSVLNSRMSRNENNQMPLHYAVRRNRPKMVSLLLDLVLIRCWGCSECR